MAASSECKDKSSAFRIFMTYDPRDRDLQRSITQSSAVREGLKLAKVARKDELLTVKAQCALKEQSAAKKNAIKEHVQQMKVARENLGTRRDREMRKVTLATHAKLKKIEREYKDKMKDIERETEAKVKTKAKAKAKATLRKDDK